MTEPTCQLAAIMFTDIVGYPAIMGRNAQKAMALVCQSREVQKPLVAQYHGKWLKEMGDGVLVSLNATSEAVWCAKAILNEVEQFADLKIKVGIHLGAFEI